ncbi:MAG: acyl-CoA thioesterase [Ruminiclostridium sp.]
MNKIKPYERTAYYYETDQMGIVHHSNYIRWMEETRIDFLEKAGYPYDQMEKDGFLIPVLSVSCKYKVSVKFNETVIIKAKIEEFNGFKMKISYEIINKESGELRATGESTHCFLTKELKPVRVAKGTKVFEVFNNVLGQDIYE